MEELRFQITDEMEDERIDKCMSLLVENLSRSFIQKLIKDGNVLVNGTPVKGSCRVKWGWWCIRRRDITAALWLMH